MKKGSFLYFVPPMLSGETLKNGIYKKRYMLIVENNAKEKIIKMINVSSLKNKEHKLLYLSNEEIKNYYPLPAPSFVKLDTLYVIDYFTELNRYIAFNGQVLNVIQFQYIDKLRLKYMKEKEIEIIQYTEKEFKKYNI